MPRRPPGVTELKAPRKGWLARYRGPDGREVSRTFETMGAAASWRADELKRVREGRWSSPADGRVTFREYAERWRAGAGHRGQSAATVESRLRLHAYPTLGDRPLAELRHSELRAWLTRLERTLAPWTVYGVHSIARTVLNAAVSDHLLPAGSPFARIPLAGVARREPVVPLTVPEVRLLLEHASPPYRALFALGAATGMRGGELRGLCLEEVNLLRRTVRVERQLHHVAPAPGLPLAHAWGPPKTPRSYRTLDVPRWACDELAAHLAARPAVETTLPVVDTPRVTEHTGALVFTTRTGAPIRRNGLAAAWHTAERRAELVAGGGPHALRHHVASLLIAAGESVKVVQAQLGHATAAETWDTYAHLFPDHDGRVRNALEDAWNAEPESTTEERDAR